MIIGFSQSKFIKNPYFLPPNLIWGSFTVDPGFYNELTGFFFVFFFRIRMTSYETIFKMIHKKPNDCYDQVHC